MTRPSSEIDPFLSTARTFLDQHAGERGGGLGLPREYAADCGVPFIQVRRHKIPVGTV